MMELEKLNKMRKEFNEAMSWSLPSLVRERPETKNFTEQAIAQALNERKEGIKKSFVKKLSALIVEAEEGVEKSEQDVIKAKYPLTLKTASTFDNILGEMQIGNAIAFLKAGHNETAVFNEIASSLDSRRDYASELIRLIRLSVQNKKIPSQAESELLRRIDVLEHSDKKLSSALSKCEEALKAKDIANAFLNSVESGSQYFRHAELMPLMTETEKMEALSHSGGSQLERIAFTRQSKEACDKV